MKLRFSISILVCLLSIAKLGAQTNYTMSNGTITSCSGVLLDPGGTGNYTSNLDITQTICSGTPGSQIEIDFGVLDLEEGAYSGTPYDWIVVYEGVDNTGGVRLAQSSSGDPVKVSSTTGCLTVVFHSDGGTNNSGFTAPFSCTSCSDGILNGTETSIDCGGPSCPACPNCFNGIQDGNETGIDVGPSCPNASHCSNGVLDGDETSIDCGGSCLVCPVDCNVTIQATTPTGCCDYTLKLYDTGNDGWRSSANLEVFVNNSSVGTFIPPTTTDPFTLYTFSACNEDDIRLDFTKSYSTSQNNEIGIEFLDPEGNILYSLATGTNPATNTNLFSISGNCPPDLTCNGGQVELIASGIGTTITSMDNDFDAGSPGSGWITSTSATYTNPCIASLDGGTYMWMGNASPTPRKMETSPLDISCGGELCFLLAYAIQGDNSPCEGPDLPDEGVSLQYSVDGGVTWVDIAYWHPDGTLMVSSTTAGSTASGVTAFTDWKQYCFDIPAGAITNYTSFRWIQPNGTNTNTDHWGIDNVTISSVVNCAPYVYDWDNIAGVDNGATQSVTITNDQTYNVTYTNQAGDQCSSSVSINIPDNITINANVDQDETCQGDADGAISSNPSGGSGDYSYSWNTTPVQTTQNISGLIQGTYTLTVTDNITLCVNDTTVTVNTTNNDDATFSLTPTCDGATATISGTTGGTFTFTTPPADAAVIDASTGTVTNGTSGATYDITYTTSGTCSATSNQTVTVTSQDDPTFSLTPTCDGATATISGTTGGTFTFTTPPADAAVIDGSTGTITNGTFGTTYDITYTTSGTCSATSNQTVTVTSQDDPTFSLTPTCDGATATISGTTGGTFSFTSAPSDAAVIDGSTGTITNGTSGNSYNVTYTTAGACPNSSNQSVTASNSDDASFTVSASCNGGTISSVVTSGGTFTFSTPPSDGASIDASTGEVTNGVSGTTYNITYTTSGICTANSSQPLTVTSSDDPSFTLTPTCDGATATISGTTGGTFTFTTPPSDAAVIDASTGTITGGTSGATYDVTYTTLGVCTANSSQTVTVASQDDATFSLTPTCDGATANISGTTGGTFTFTTPPADAAVIDASTGTITNGTFGATYDITYTTSGTCSATSNQTVTVTSQDDATFSLTPTCDGATATISGTTGGTFTFTTPPADAAVIDGSTGTISNGTSGNSYNLTYTTAGACPNSSNQSVTASNSDDASFTVAASCTGGTISSVVTSGGTFTFSTPPSDGASIDASTGEVTNGVSGTTYNITYTTSGICTANSSQPLTVTSSDDPSFTLTSTCDGATATISGTTGGTFTFTAPPADAAVIDASTGTITGGTSGATYDVTYTTSGTCSATSNQTVTVTSQDDATFSLTPTCDGGTASITGTTGGTFTFTTPPSDVAVIDASTGTTTNGTSGATYDITYTTSGTCSAVSNQTLTVITQDDATFSLSPTCDGATATISGTTGGTFTFTTPPADAAVIDASTGTVTNGSTNSSYDITYTTSGTCTATSNQTVTVITQDDPSFSLTPTCDGATATISGTTGGTFTFTTPPADAAVIDASTGTVTNGSSGVTYDITYTTSGTCIATSNQTATVTSQDDATFTLSPTCDGATAIISGTTGGTFTFTTPPTDAAIIDAFTGTVTNGTSGATYDITYTTSGTCNETSNQNVTVITQDDATFTLNPTCDGATANVSGTTGGTFTFTTPPADAAVIDASTGTVTNGNPSSVYGITYTTVGTCPNTSNQTVTSKPLLTPSVTCGTNSRSSVSFEWTMPTGASSFDISYVVNSTTIQNGGNQALNSYTVNGLSVDDEVVITITTNGSECYADVSRTCFAASCIPSQALFYPDPKTVTASVPKTTFQNSSTNSIGYYWDFGDGTTSTEANPEHEYATSDVEVYNVMLIAFNEDACNDTIIQSVLVSEELIYYVPNSFTPNEDQFNNEFLPVFYSGHDPYNYSMYIFDRWGEIVFETHDIEKGWNGTFGSSDKKVQDGVYIWKIEFKRKGIDKIEKAMGHVILNR